MRDHEKRKLLVVSASQSWELFCILQARDLACVMSHAREVTVFLNIYYKSKKEKNNIRISA